VEVDAVADAHASELNNFLDVAVLGVDGLASVIDSGKSSLAFKFLSNLAEHGLVDFKLGVGVLLLDHINGHNEGRLERIDHTEVALKLVQRGVLEAIDDQSDREVWVLLLEFSLYFLVNVQNSSLIEHLLRVPSLDGEELNPQLDPGVSIADEVLQTVEKVFTEQVFLVEDLQKAADLLFEDFPHSRGMRVLMGLSPRELGDLQERLFEFLLVRILFPDLLGSEPPCSCSFFGGSVHPLVDVVADVDPGVVQHVSLNLC
jgi:hypothetical protein